MVTCVGFTVHPAAVQPPNIATDSADLVEQVGPESEIVTLPETLVGMMVPVIVPLSEQPPSAMSQARKENGMEKAPLLSTIVVPERSGGVQPVRPPLPSKGTPLGAALTT